MIYVKINNNEYPAAISGIMENRVWDNRSTKEITLSITYAEAAELFIDDVQWSIIEKDDNNEVVNEWDNSEYCLAGDITDHRDGTISVIMGKMTELEEANEMIIGG